MSLSLATLSFPGCLSQAPSLLLMILLFFGQASGQSTAPPILARSVDELRAAVLANQNVEIVFQAGELREPLVIAGSGIVVRAAAGYRPVLTAAVPRLGHMIIVEGDDIACCEGVTISDEVNTPPSGGVLVRGDRADIRGMVIDRVYYGVASYADALATRIDGNEIRNSPANGDCYYGGGQAIRVANVAGAPWKYVRGNYIHDNECIGLSTYNTGPEVHRIQFVNNVVERNFNNILLGHERPQSGIRLIGNVTYGGKHRIPHDFYRTVMPDLYLADNSICCVITFPGAYPNVYFNGNRIYGPAWNAPSGANDIFTFRPTAGEASRTVTIPGFPGSYWQITYAWGQETEFRVSRLESPDRDAEPTQNDE